MQRCSFRLPQNRLQIGVTLLLTSITFRWTVNRSLVGLQASLSLFDQCIVVVSLADDLLSDLVG